MSEQIKVLLVEDNPGDAALMRAALEESLGAALVEHAETVADALKIMDAGRWDVVLLDLSLPDSTGLETVQAMLPVAGHVPLVVLTGLESDDLALHAVRLGAQDYLNKNDITPPLLQRAIGYAIQRAKLREELQRQKEDHLHKLNLVLQAATDALAETTIERLLSHVTEAARNVIPCRGAVAAYGYREGRFELAGASSEHGTSLLATDFCKITHGGVHLGIICEGRTLRLTDEELHRDAAWWGVPEGHMPLRGLLGVPLAARDGKPIGLIMVTDRLDGGDFSLEDEARLSQMAAIVALALQHIEARNQAEELVGHLRVARDQLEQRVAERTADLQSAVEALQDEVIARMAAEAQLRRANGSLQMITECDQALVRAESEQGLLQDICAIIGRVGGYELAWVGLTVEDDQSLVRPAAHWGFTGQESTSCLPGHAVQPLCDGALGQALRSGQPIVSRDLSDGTAACRWRQEAIDRNCRMLLSLPLRSAGGVLGLLNIYTGNPDAFDTPEIKLLGELADDLAFGITALRTRHQRSLAQQALRDSNELLEKVFSNTHMYVAYMDRDFQFVRVNRRYAESTGRSEEFFVGKNHFDLYPNKEVQDIFRKVVQTGEPHVAFEQALTFVDHGDNGTAYWNWSVVPVRESDGQVAGLVLSLLDVTEHRRSREALRESERQAQRARLELASLVESSDDPIFGVSLDGTVTSWNGGAQRVWGYDAAEVTGQGLAMLMAPSRVKDVAGVLANVAAGQRVAAFDTVAVGKARGRIDLSMIISAVRDADGAVVGASLIARDMTEQRRLEREVLKVSELERQRIGHDLHDMLGQNLTGVAFLGKVLEQKLAAKDLPEAADAQEISRLLNDSTSLTRSLARGLVPVQMKAEGLMTALRELSGEAEKYMGIACNFFCSRPVTIEDASVANHLFRIVQEALSNAVRHGKANRVDIELTRGADGVVTLLVRDDGVGLPRGTRKAAKGMGLRIMSYRANSIGASLSINRSGQRGTVVKCTVVSGTD